MGVSQSTTSRRSAISEINVTPFVDVMLVLLIIFMVTAPMMQQGLSVEVPETKPTGVEISEDPFIIVIKKDSSIWLGKTKVSQSELSEKIKSIFSVKKTKQVYIQADKKVEYGVIAETMADVKASGITSIGLITQPYK